MQSYKDFFVWGETHGLKTDRLVATAFGMTPQTVRNWKAKTQPSKDGTLPAPPHWLGLACLGYEAMGDTIPTAQSVSIAWFEVWRRRHGLDTLERTGGAFGLTRQAVHNWFKRRSLPHWLGLACRGYERQVSGGSV